MQFLLSLILVLSFSFLTKAQNLDLRNIPEARKIYEDTSGVYYGAMLSSNGFHPKDSAPSDIELMIFAERTISSTGSYFEGHEASIQTAPSEASKSGFTYSEVEITRFSNHIIPALYAAFPEWKSHPRYQPNRRRVTAWVYIKDNYLHPYGGGKKESFEAEDPVIYLTFKRSIDGKSWRPGYEIDGLAGVPYGIEYLTASTILKHRKPKSTQHTSVTADISAMFERHKVQKQLLEKKRYDGYAGILKWSKRPGLVYKSGAYWSSYKNFETPRNIIEGNFQFIANAGDFAKSYVMYVEQYSKLCKTYLPASRIRYTESWFQTRYGITTPYGQKSVDMENRLAKKYEAMANAKYLSGDFSTLAIIGAALTSNGDTFSFARNSLTSLQEELVSDAETARFLNNEGCASPIVKQYAENLYRGANNLKPVQTTRINFVKPTLNFKPATHKDVLRYIRKTYEARARNPKKTEDGYTFYSQNIIAYRTGMGLAADGRGQNENMRPIGLVIERKGYPILQCQYGPIGVLASGELDTDSVSFWYEKKPKELEDLLSATDVASDVYPGIRHAISTCPKTSEAARNIFR
ncbi:MAG: hypothetical protein ACPG52_06505 [Cognaticolwellia sp.]